jgi:two-component system cell cycle sensor histidine kinase/response regulator CckA
MSEALRLFLVEDDDDIALLMRKALQRAGHHVTRCRTAADALIVLGHSSFDLVLLDHRLPDMSGLELLQALGREGITTPVLMVTGYGDEQLATQVLRAGALDYVVKDPALTFLTELPKRVSESVTRHGLQDMNRLLIASLESARDGIAISDLQGRFLHVNHALERMSGYSRDELLGQTPRLFKSGLHPPEFYAGMWRTILARNSWQGEVINRRKDGTLLDASLTISPILDSRGQMTHFVAIYRDISDRKQLERQLLQAQKMQSVGTLAGGVAHEFNNLLAGIQGYADLGLREPGLSPTSREYFEHIINLTSRAANLTRQLLAYARKPALSSQPVRMDKLVRSTADLVGHTLHTEVRLELPAEGPARDGLVALADANQLQQVLINLALNARDAMTAAHKGDNGQAAGPPGPIVFGLRQALLQGDLPAFPENVPPGDYVVIEVRDSGIGMTPEVLAQALDPFFTTKEVGQGTGLGLPVAFGIVRSHQGFLTIDTAPGQGTCISLYLPRLHAPGPGTALFEPGQVLEPESAPSRHILVVDDEEAVLDVVRRFLEIAGHQVTCATGGEQAVQLLAEGLPAELVILDLVMPGEEGAVTFQRIHQLRPDLPVLLCTGIVQADAPPLLADGAAGLLRKPFRMNELWYAVNQALPAAESPPH